MQFDKERYFFCQSSETKGLHQISSFNAGKQLKEAVEASNNQQWQVQLSATLNPYDAHAYDFKYHLPCWVRHVQRSQSSKNYEDPSETQNPGSQESCITAEIEFFSLLEDLISSGNILDMDAVHNIYHTLLKLHNAEKEVESRRQLKE